MIKGFSVVSLASFLFSVATVDTTAAFTHPPAFSNKSTRGVSSLLVSQPIIPEKDETERTNPSGVFGKPLSEDLEDFNRFAVGLIKNTVFDTLFAGKGREYARFYALETIAREPYFAYLGALHFYETAGMWRKANYLKIHFAEEWNELHHLLIMEELGGADRWLDRFISQHIAVAYYWIVLAIYFYNPTMAYNLNQAVEEHAYATYDQFLTENSEELKTKPAPQVAIDYYRDGDLYMFDEFQTDTCDARRPTINNLYDVFVAIRDDEAEHVKTMKLLQDDVELQTSHDATCEVPPEMYQGV
mmetsp:Transcript_6393/g.8641  ORF Transcript_6393/g.8641 Transcript_6393/m.8641 type:complete len:301 (-) Transcript_6393:6-908(-)|eukprot:CAMPEP_0185725022 /NCGR_PEP_ID=MMETSP1171-20130828/1346_1 /TAXON_ID=374046 /ORGANISM="Helicotheca tamensis, Strain CCMP826" /LENGTH=300 /DNA_ID=CAMNT_0028393011 /DNA_START=242 /DNA_END=1144 /DNA_ORIENTATION=-